MVSEANLDDFLLGSVWSILEMLLFLLSVILLFYMKICLIYFYIQLKINKLDFYI